MVKICFLSFSFLQQVVELLSLLEFADLYLVVELEQVQVF